MSFHVIVGAGAPGTATARILAERGERVRVVTRSGSGPDHPNIELVAADANDADRLTEFTTGAKTLFNCAMPPYDQWPALWPPLAAGMLAAAERTGVDYVNLGNAYGYGAVDGPLTEDLPLAPNSTKGEVRAKMWTDALAAHEAGRVRTTEVRPGDFLGPRAYSIFTLFVAPPILAGEPAVLPADLDVPHAWSYTGDVARALVAAADNDQSWGRVWHAPITSSATVREAATRFAELAGVAAPTLVVMSEEELAAAAAENSLMAELPEMQYQWRRPFLIDSSFSEQALGIQPSSLDEALRTTAEALAAA